MPRIYHFSILTLLIGGSPSIISFSVFTSALILKISALYTVRSSPTTDKSTWVPRVSSCEGWTSPSVTWLTNSWSCDWAETPVWTWRCWLHSSLPQILLPWPLSCCRPSLSWSWRSWLGGPWTRSSRPCCTPSSPGPAVSLVCLWTAAARVPCPQRPWSRWCSSWWRPTLPGSSLAHPAEQKKYTSTPFLNDNWYRPCHSSLLTE